MKKVFLRALIGILAAALVFGAVPISAAQASVSDAVGSDAGNEAVQRSVAFAAEDMRVLEEGVPNVIEYSPELLGNIVYMKFIPESSGYYRISSGGIDENWSGNVNYRITNSSGNELGIGMVSSWSNDPVQCNFTAGETYEFYFDFYVDDSGSFDFTVSEWVGIVSLEIDTPPDRTAYIKGECYWPDMTGLSVKAALSDGSTAYWNYSDFDADNDIIGYPVSTGVNTDNDGNFTDITVQCANLQAVFPLTVRESPFESIEYVGDGVVVYEEGDGYFNGEFYQYDYSLKGHSFRINYKNGASSLFEINRNYDIEIDGYQLAFADNQWEVGGWIMGGDNYITADFCGISCQIPVVIKPNPVESVKLIEVGKPRYIFGDPFYGYTVVGDDGNALYYFYPHHDDYNLEVTYTDGSKKIYTAADRDNESNINGIGWYLQEVEMTSADKFEFSASYCGKTYTVEAEMEASPVKSVEVLSMPKPSVYSFAYNACVGMTLKIIYSDGGTETVTVTKDMIGYNNKSTEYAGIVGVNAFIDGYPLEIIESYYTGDTYICYLGALCQIQQSTPVYSEEDIEYIKFVKVCEGIFGSVVRYGFNDGTSVDIALNADYVFKDGFSYTAETSYGYVSFYVEDGYVMLGDTEVVIPPATGDFNGDGAVDIKDLIRLKKYLAGIAELETDPDLNGDGAVDSCDLAEMRKILIGAASL